MTPLEQRARDLAMERHAMQAYGKTPGARVPYTFHLAHVVGVLARLGEDSPVLRAAGWLHDLLEDTDATLGDMRMALTYAGGPFNTSKTLDGEEVETVIFLVRAVTKTKGLSRREGNADYLAQVRAGGKRAVLLKVADRIANVEASVFAGSSMVRMYRQEQAQFLSLLHREEDGIEEAWSMLRATLEAAP